MLCLWVPTVCLGVRDLESAFQLRAIVSTRDAVCNRFPEHVFSQHVLGLAGYLSSFAWHSTCQCTAAQNTLCVTQTSLGDHDRSDGSITTISTIGLSRTTLSGRGKSGSVSTRNKEQASNAMLGIMKGRTIEYMDKCLRACTGMVHCGGVGRGINAPWSDSLIFNSP